MRNGIPIGLGYFAVSFALGIKAREAGLTAFEGFFASFFTIASAGEYAGFLVIAQQASYWQMALMTLIASGRYFLMSCSMSQKLHPNLRFIHRPVVGFLMTDEIFGASMSENGYLNPYFTYGLGITSVLPWAIGTALGIISGNILPDFVVNALSVALYGMFIAIIIPPAKKSKIIGCLVLISFALSFICDYIPVIADNISSGNRIIILTVIISAAAALIFPVKEDKYEKEESAK